jgi:hypothetical protein
VEWSYEKHTHAFPDEERAVDFQLLSNIVNVEMDRATGWVKATRATGETFLIQPRDLLTLMTWGQGNAQALVASQQVLDAEVALYEKFVQGQARPVRLVEALPPEPTSQHRSPSRKRKRRRPLPLPIIQISQAFPCLLGCKTTIMTALVDFGASLHDPWQLYPFCEDHLRQVLAEREATGGLSLRMIVEELRANLPDDR